jgi:hypothetical protein
MAATLKYNLKEITDLSFSGFEYTIPDDIVVMINNLCLQVGSPGITSSIFKKTVGDNIDNQDINGSFKMNKKRKGNRSMEISSEEWESIRTFQATKIEQKSGIEGDIDQIRLLLNKLTDKTFLDIKEKLIEKINNICEKASNDSDLVKVGMMIYDVSSTNKFYSRVFAELFSELLSLYTWLMPIFKEHSQNIMKQYQNIRYIEPEKDYDGFCDMNKENEKRKAVTTFFVNLAINGVIPKETIIQMLTDLLSIVVNMVNETDKKNEVDELTENIAILFNKTILDVVVNADDYDEDDYLVNDEHIVDVIKRLAKCKAKDYISLSNKSIFKFMDLIEM